VNPFPIPEKTLKFSFLMPIKILPGCGIKEVCMVISTYSVDSMLNAYSKLQRVKARNRGASGGEGDGKMRSADEVTLSKQGLEAADVYNKITDKLIDNILKDDKK
jgi:hypothetical protein